MTQKLDTKRLASTLVEGAKKYIDQAIDGFNGRLRKTEDRLLVLETMLGMNDKATKPRIRVPAGKDPKE